MIHYDEDFKYNLCSCLLFKNGGKILNAFLDGLICLNPSLLKDTRSAVNKIALIPHDTGPLINKVKDFGLYLGSDYKYYDEHGDLQTKFVVDDLSVHLVASFIKNISLSKGAPYGVAVNKTVKGFMKSLIKEVLLYHCYPLRTVTRGDAVRRIAGIKKGSSSLIPAVAACSADVILSHATNCAFDLAFERFWLIHFGKDVSAEKVTSKEDQNKESSSEDGQLLDAVAA